jgi:hypothetical protein
MPKDYLAVCVPQLCLSSARILGKSVVVKIKTPFPTFISEKQIKRQNNECCKRTI